MARHDDPSWGPEDDELVRTWRAFTTRFAERLRGTA